MPPCTRNVVSVLGDGLGTQSMEPSRPGYAGLDHVPPALGAAGSFEAAGADIVERSRGGELPRERVIAVRNGPGGGGSLERRVLAERLGDEDEDRPHPPRLAPLSERTFQDPGPRRDDGGTVTAGALGHTKDIAAGSGHNLRDRVVGAGINSVHDNASGGPSRYCSSTLNFVSVAPCGDRDGHELAERSSAARGAQAHDRQLRTGGRGASCGLGEAEATVCAAKRRRISVGCPPAAVGPRAAAGDELRNWTSRAGRPPDDAGGGGEDRVAG